MNRALNRRSGPALERRRRRQTGMSILEVVISMAVLVIASLTVATSTTSSFQAVDRSDSIIRVENAVRETMESLRVVDFDNLDALNGNQLYVNDAEKNIIITIRVNQISTTFKAIELEVFRKVRTGASTVVRGERVFQALTYRSER